MAVDGLDVGRIEGELERSITQGMIQPELGDALHPLLHGVPVLTVAPSGTADGLFVLARAK